MQRGTMSGARRPDRTLKEKHAAELLSLQQEDRAQLAQEKEEAESKYVRDYTTATQGKAIEFHLDKGTLDLPPNRPDSTCPVIWCPGLWLLKPAVNKTSQGHGPGQPPLPSNPLALTGRSNLLCSQLGKEYAYAVVTLEELYELHKELGLVKSSFKTYQESLSEEMNEAWRQKETRLKESFEEQKLIDISMQRQSLMDVFEAEKKELHRRAVEEQAMILQSHEAQIEDTWKKYKEAAQETKMLNLLKKDDIAEKNEAILSLTADLQHAHTENEKLKSQIDKIEKSFDQSVSKVESKYKIRIQTLMNENADIRYR
ncbi:unnamed protein product [Ranitomeya imitator]|uniref:Uncharacterized protein n=1 Tax=Ranitomeya imitator TaxID=111125 RepID=A0ABN9LDC5_9NEOB|nr:unnamed protein product [Ranitomeya imitator]